MKRLAIMLLLGLLAACGGGGGDGTSVPVADIYPPAVTATSPANGAVNVPVSAGITIFMNEMLDPASVTASKIVVSSNGGNLAGSVQVTGTSFTFTPNAMQAANTVYTVAVQPGIKDLAGNATTATTTFSYTTGAGATALTNGSATFFTQVAGQANWTPSTGILNVLSQPAQPWHVQLAWSAIPVVAGNPRHFTLSCTGGNTVSLELLNASTFVSYAFQTATCNGNKDVVLTPSTTDANSRFEIKFGIPASSYPAQYIINNVAYQ